MKRFPRKLLWLLLVLVAIAAVCTAGHFSEKRRSEKKAADVLALVAHESDIHAAARILADNGYRPTRVVDSTGLGQQLSFTVRITSPSFIDTISYASDTNLAPWRGQIVSHVIIYAKPDGTITKRVVV